MVLTSFRSALSASAVLAACLVSHVHGHGYMLIPESQFTGSATSSWIVQIDPTWASDDWDGNNAQSVTTYQTLAAENGVTNIRPLLDDTSLYGADCGYTDPDGTAQPIPTDSTATFSRAIQHVGPCEIWLDDTMVFHDDNCYAGYGSETETDKSVFPVDYSQCDSGGCSMMRFYWLAFQGVDDETVWQVYKDCIPLEGGSSSTSSTTTDTTSASDDEETASSMSTTPALSTDEEGSLSSESTTSSPSTSEESSTEESSSTETEADTTSATSTSAPTSTDASSTESEASTPTPNSNNNDGNAQGSNNGGWRGGFGRRLKH